MTHTTTPPPSPDLSSTLTIRANRLVRTVRIAECLACGYDRFLSNPDRTEREIQRFDWVTPLCRQPCALRLRGEALATMAGLPGGSEPRVGPASVRHPAFLGGTVRRRRLGRSYDVWRRAWRSSLRDQPGPHIPRHSQVSAEIWPFGTLVICCDWN